VTENLRLHSAGWAFPGIFGNPMKRSGDETPREMVAPRSLDEALGKVPEVALSFWIIKIAATTLGDWVADSGPGYEGGALIFAGCIAVVALIYFFTRTSRAVLFWAAFVLTRPLGATLGDLLTKPVASGGLNLSRYSSSAAIACFIVICILVFPQRAG